MNLLFFVYLFFFGFQQVGIPVPVPETIRIADQNFQKVEFQSDIITLFQDSRGLIWLGNRNGFVIYDGVEIFEYTEDFTDSSASRFRGQEVLKFAEDKFGRVWISTHSGGLNIFEKGTITHLNLETTNWAPPNVYGKDIVIQDSIAWFSTNQSLSRIRITEDISEISGIDFLSDWETHGIIHSFIPNEKGGLTGIGRGVFDIKYSDSQGIEVESIIESEDFFNRIIEDKNGNVLISQNQFLHIVGENRIKKTITIDVPDTDEHAMIKNLFIDNVGDLWVSAEQGFLRITYDSLYQVINSDFYESTPVENIIQDHSGNMWITQLDRSTLILNASYKMFDVIKYPESYNQKKAFLYLDDGYGNLWIAGELGIIIYNLDTKEFITVDEEPTLIDETVFSLLKDTQGNIWAGTSSYVVRYNPVTYEVKKWANRDMDPSYFSSWMEWYGAHNFSLDNFGNIWLLIQQTLTRIDPLTEEFTFHVKGGNSIDKILIDDEGKMWIWGNDRAIRVFDVTENGIIWNNDTYLDDTIDSEVSRIMDDGFGRIWIAWSAGIYI
ncbi:MAG: ligand-binding sensor domain-containing protein, partial [Balneolaceae bacterium]